MAQPPTWENWLIPRNHSRQRSSYQAQAEKNLAENRDYLNFLMNSTQANSWHCLQRAIDAEIKALEESAQVLKLRRNALSPISSLLPEIFAAIFSFLCLPRKPRHHRARHHRARLRVSHVCHQWREIALNQPLLWSYVDFTSLSLTGATEIFFRSKSVPLYLEARVVGHRQDDFNSFVKAHVPRLCHLSISARNLKLTIRELPSPAPSLKYLSLISRKKGEVIIPDTLFNGSTPRLSCLDLRNCDISWRSPLLKGLKHLEILTSSENARPNLTIWLDALNEMPQLKELTLHSASPVAPPLPFDVERTATLPSLTHLDISASVGDCALALAHLDLPSLTWLCLTVVIDHPDRSNVQGVLPYVVRHAHGPQDIQPLQSLLISNDASHLNILAWPVPDTDVDMNDPPTFLGTTIPTRVALSFKHSNWRDNNTHLNILDTVMASLPLDGLVMLAAQDLVFDSSLAEGLSTQQFWLRHSQKWPLLRRVRLAPPVDRGFVEMLLGDNGERDGLLLPSLKELVLVQGESGGQCTHLLCDALIKRVEQGVPLEMLDLRMYYRWRGPAEVRLLSEIVVDVLVPEEEMWSRLTSLWELLARGPFVEDDNPYDEDDDD